MNTRTLLSKNSNGELIYKNLGDYLNAIYKPDTIFVRSFFCYVCMILFATTDGFTFYNLTAYASYASLMVKAMMVVGMLVGFDVVPVYVGILHKRLSLNLTKDKTPLYIALAACAAALVLNVVLNILCIDIMNAASSSSQVTNYINTAEAQAAAQAAAQTGTDTNSIRTITMTIFRITCPFITSVSSYFISYMCYNPLETREYNLKVALCEKKDEVRRLTASVDEYDRDPDFDKKLLEDVYKEYEAQKLMYRARVTSYIKHVEQKLKEHLADSSATSALSEDGCKAIIEALNSELEAFLKASGSGKTAQEDTDTTNITNYIAV